MQVSTAPSGVVLDKVSAQIFAVLSRYTAFPWPILQTQSRRLGLDPAKLRLADLPKLTSYLVAGIERFSSPDKAKKAEEEFRALAAPLGRGSTAP